MDRNCDYLMSKSNQCKLTHHKCREGLCPQLPKLFPNKNSMSNWMAKKPCSLTSDTLPRLIREREAQISVMKERLAKDELKRNAFK